MSPHRTPPRPPSLYELTHRLDALEANTQILVESGQEHAIQMGTLVAAMARLERTLSDVRADVVGHRGRLESVPDLVEEVTQRRVVSVLEHKELDTWRARRDFWTKVAATVIGGAALIVVAYFFGKFTK